MKRGAAYGLLAAVVAVLIGAGAWGAAWLTGTTEGIRWLMDAVSRHTSLTISAREVDGRLIDRLQLAGVRVTLAPLEAEIDRLDFRWAPLRLLSGRIAAKELTLTGIRVRDNSPRETPPDLAWPEVPWLAGLFDGGIDRLRIDGLTYRRLDGPPVDMTTASASVLWRNTLLSLSELSIVAPSGRVMGSIAAGLSLPSLRFDLAVTPAAPVAGMDAFLLQGRFLPGRSPEELAGGFTASGSAGTVKRLELAGEAGMTRRSFNLRRLRLERPGHRGTLTGGGTVTLTAGEPLLALELGAAGLDLSPELNVPTDFSGSLTLTGTPALYRGEFTLANRGKGWRTAHLAGAYQGDGAEVKLGPLRGALLAGSIEGSLGVRWQDGISLEGAITGRNLNPAGIDPDWTGVVNFDLAGEIAWKGQDPPKGKVKGMLLESRLHGQALTGAVKADFAAGDLHFDRLALQGKGFAITAAGELGQRLAFDVRIADLGRLIPRTDGELRADGWVRWRDRRLDGSVAGRGANLAAGGLRVAAVDLSARLGGEKGALPHIAATLRRVTYEGFRADSVILEADGTAERHTGNAALRAGGTEARAALSGAYSRGRWQGEIVSFSGHDGVGPWSLAAPAALSFAAGRIILAPLAITGVQPERLEIAGDLTTEPPGGDLRVAWNGLNLARLNPWLTEVRAAGATSGSIRLRFPQGEPPAFSGTARAKGTVTAERYGITAKEGSLTLDGDEQGLRAGIELRMAGGGVLNGTFSSPAPARLAIPETGKIAAEWMDIDLAPLRRWLPAELTLTGRLAGRASGNLLAREQFDLTGKASLTQGQVRWQRGNNGLDAAVRTAELSIGWQGAIRGPAAAGEAGRLVLEGRAGASGALTVDGRRIGFDQIAVNLDGNERGMQAKIDLSLTGGGTAKGRFSSPRPAALAIPGEGEVTLEWAGIDVFLLRPWLPESLSMDGNLAGRAKGGLLPGERLTLTGDASLSGGKVRWMRPGGEIKGSLRSASLSWDWRGEALRGTVALAFAEQGEARGSFQLPLPARFPAVIDHKGPLQAALTGEVREQGILTSLFPGMIRESHGELGADLSLGGTWEEPKIGGTLKLAKAGAYLPTAGIHVRDFQLAMRLEKELVRIDSFRALSGPGQIEGTALVRLKGWEVAGYQGSISGERFQAVYLPEMQILGSPKLTFEGTPEKLNIRGEVRLPELVIVSQPARAAVLPSKDVILVGVPKPVEKGSPMALDVQVRVVLGEKVLVKVEGIDAQLDGSIDLAFRSLDNITSKGEIRVVKGRYRAYGVDLEIVRGRLFYAGGPLNQPTLDILALRTVGDVKAGVTAGGILRAPAIKLYSEPAMPDVDTLAYIVFGHPLGNGNTGEQAAMMAQVAGALLSRGQSSALQEQIKSRLGLSTLELQSTAETSGRMGYKQIPVAPAGVAAARQTAGVAQTMLTVGKYLTPQLYFSYGRSLFTGGNLFRLRYDIFKQWQIETQTGSESGVDLYYKIDFN